MNERIDSLQKKIDPIREYYFGKENQKGIQNDSHTLNSQLYSAFYSISEYENGTNSRTAVMNCRRSVEKGVEMIDACMKNEYTALKNLVEAMRFEYFKKL